MKNSRGVFSRIAFVAALSLAVLASPLAHANHGTQAAVDSIEGTGSGTFFGSILGSGDTADWYTFFATAGTSIGIQTTAATFDTTLTLYLDPDETQVGDLRSSFTEIAFDDDGGAGLLSLLSFALAATGNYVIAVEEFGDSGGNYTLEVRNVLPVASVPEPATLALLGLGLLGIGCARRRK